MFGIGFPELMVILVVALIFIGPNKLPQVARSIGSGYRELQKALAGVKDEMENAKGDFQGGGAPRAPMPPQSEEEKKENSDNPADRDGVS